MTRSDERSRVNVRNPLLAAAVAIAVVGVTACGGDDSDASTGATTLSTASAPSTAASAFNDADVTFAQSMIPHHEQAIEMAEMALDPSSGAGADVTALAKQIQAAQDPEIAQMKQWLSAWGMSTQMDSSGHDMESMDGMMTASDMQALAAATGPAFDQLWLTMMIEHHEGAIAMANTALSAGESSDVNQLANAIVEGQQAEIDTMNGLLGSSS